MNLRSAIVLGAGLASSLIGLAGCPDQTQSYPPPASGPPNTGTSPTSSGGTGGGGTTTLDLCGCIVSLHTGGCSDCADMSIQTTAPCYSSAMDCNDAAPCKADIECVGACFGDASSPDPTCVGACLKSATALYLKYASCICSTCAGVCSDSTVTCQ